MFFYVTNYGTSGTVWHCIAPQVLQGRAQKFERKRGRNFRRPPEDQKKKKRFSRLSTSNLPLDIK